MSGARGNLTAQAHRPDLSPFLMKAIGPRRGWNRVPNSVGGPSGCPPTHWPSGTRATHARTRAKPVRPRERAPARLCRPAFFLHTQSATTSCLLVPALTSCPKFSQWWTVIWKDKPDKPFSPKLFGYHIYYSNRERN